ncbi:hypothetical protein KR215_007747 [Drosophila sulfurigaster]|nr:hypothetical protein KR215_007747 [Drosophila sulfurigaster]
MCDDPRPEAAALRVQCYPMIPMYNGNATECTFGVMAENMYVRVFSFVCMSTECMPSTQRGRFKLICRGQLFAGCTMDRVRCSIPSPGIRCQARHHSRPVAVIIEGIEQAISMYWQNDNSQ